MRAIFSSLYVRWHQDGAIWHLVVSCSSLAVTDQKADTEFAELHYHLYILWSYAFPASRYIYEVERPARTLKGGQNIN